MGENLLQMGYIDFKRNKLIHVEVDGKKLRQPYVPYLGGDNDECGQEAAVQRAEGGAP